MLSQTFSYTRRLASLAQRLLPNDLKVRDEQEAHQPAMLANLLVYG